MGSTNGFFGRCWPHWRNLQGTCLMVPVNSSGLLPVYSGGMECPSAPWLMGSQPSDRSWESHACSASLKLGAFLQGCRAVGDPFLLWVILVLDIFIKLFSRTAADSPHPPKAFPALTRHRETPAPPVPGNLQMEFFRGTFCLQRFHFGRQLKALRARFLHRFGHLSVDQRGRLGCRARDQGLCVQPQLHLPEKNTTKQAEKHV